MDLDMESHTLDIVIIPKSIFTYRGKKGVGLFHKKKPEKTHCVNLASEYSYFGKYVVLKFGIFFST